MKVKVYDAENGVHEVEVEKNGCKNASSSLKKVFPNKTYLETVEEKAVDITIEIPDSEVEKYIIK